MTKEQLISALAKIQSYDVNIEALIDSNVIDVTDLTDEEMVRKSAEELYSDKLLADLNKRLRYVTACDMYIDGVIMSEEAVGYEQDIQHGVNIIEKIWPKRAVCVGYDSGECGTRDYMMYCQNIETYIDEDGEVFCVNSRDYSIVYSDTDIDDCPRLLHRKLEESETLWLLNSIEDFFPAKYKGFWDT